MVTNEIKFKRISNIFLSSKMSSSFRYGRQLFTIHCYVTIVNSFFCKEGSNLHGCIVSEPHVTDQKRIWSELRLKSTLSLNN